MSRGVVMKIVIVLDCGATNIRAIAVNPSGQVIAKAQEPNMTLTGYENDNWHIWPIDAIFEKFSRCTQKLMAQLPSRQIEALTVTLDAAVFKKYLFKPNSQAASSRSNFLA